jgi:transposase
MLRPEWWREKQRDGTPAAEFIGFLTGLVRKAKRAREIHIVLDNLSAHKTPAVEQFLVEHPKVRFHFTPTYSSWLYQVRRSVSRWIFSKRKAERMR